MKKKVFIAKKYITISIIVGVGMYIIEYGNFDILDIKSNIFIAICNIGENIFEIFIFIIRQIKNMKLHIIIGPIRKPRIKLLKTKYIFSVLNCIMLIGKTINCADIVTDNMSIILFDFIIFSKKFFEINFWNKTIPIVPPNENWKLKSNIVYGFWINIINADIDIFVKISLFL